MTKKQYENLKKRFELSGYLTTDETNSLMAALEDLIHTSNRIEDSWGNADEAYLDVENEETEVMKSGEDSWADDPWADSEPFKNPFQDQDFGHED